MLKSKTFWTGVAAIVAAVGGWATGEIGMPAALAGVLAGLGAIFMREGVQKAQEAAESGRARIGVIGLAALLLLSAACSTTYIDKRVVFHPRSVINGRPEVMVPGEIDSSVAGGEKGTRDVTGPTGPTGSASGEVTGSNGVISIVVHQDDGTGTTAETTPTTDVDVSGLPQ